MVDWDDVVPDKVCGPLREGAQHQVVLVAIECVEGVQTAASHASRQKPSTTHEDQLWVVEVQLNGHDQTKHDHQTVDMLV